MYIYKSWLHFDILHTALSLLIRAGTTWYVGSEVGKYEGWLKARADQAFPPTRGWSYWDGSNWLQGPNFETQIEWLFNQNNDGPSWRPVPSLECSRELSTPCKEIRVELGGKASTGSGVYLPVDGEFRYGRQVAFTILCHFL